MSDNPPRPASLSSAAQPAAATWCGGYVRLGGRQHGAEDQYKRRHRLLHSRRRPLRWLVDFTSRVDCGAHSVVTEDDALAWRHFRLGEAGWHGPEDKCDGCEGKCWTSGRRVAAMDGRLLYLALNAQLDFAAGDASSGRRR